MTVSSQVNRKDYAGNGSTTAFATEFRFLQDTDLKVILTVDSTGVETDQVLTTDYTVTGVGNDSGGTVTMIVPPATGETLTIKRDGPLTQNTDYVENDDFPAESHERALDKLTMNMQQQQEELDRSLKLSEGQTSTGLTIPAPVTGQFLQWDALGNFVNVDIALLGNVSLTTFGQSLINAIDAAAGRLVMGSAKKIATAVTDNLASFDSSDEAKDSGISAASVSTAVARVVQIADAAGLADVITAAFTPAITALTDGLEVRVKAFLANATATPTINIDSLGAKTIVKNGNNALDIADISGLGHELQLVYNSTNDNVELLNPANSGVGVGQTWQVVTGSRAINTTFTNSTGKPIQVMFNSSNNTDILVNGVEIGDTIVVNSRSVVTFIIPNGDTYRFNAAAFNSWSELR